MHTKRLSIGELVALRLSLVRANDRLNMALRAKTPNTVREQILLAQNNVTFCQELIRDTPNSAARLHATITPPE